MTAHVFVSASGYEGQGLFLDSTHACVVAISGNAAGATLLLKAGADGNIRDKAGKTLMVVAIKIESYSHEEETSCQDSLSFGNKFIRNNMKVTKESVLSHLLWTAVLNNHEDLVKVLLDNRTDHRMTNEVKANM